MSNQVKKFIETRQKIQVHLESVYGTKLNGTKNSSILYQLKAPIEVKGNVYETSMALSQFTCPISFYVVNENNWNLDIQAISGIVSIQIPEGNYNINQLIDILKNLLGVNYNININLQTYKLTITNSVEDFTILESSTCWRILGFNRLEAISSTSLTLNLPNVINLLGTQQVKIWCPTVNMSNVDGKTGTTAPILGSIVTNDINGGMILYTNMTGFRSIINEQFFIQFQIDLKDEFDMYLNLHNCDYALVLEIEYYYEKEIKNDSFISLTQKQL